MSRSVAVLSIPAILLASAWADPNPQAPSPAYIPTTMGTTLTYRVTTNVDAGPGPLGAAIPTVLESEEKHVVTSVTKTGAGTVVILSIEEDGRKDGLFYTYLVSPKGLFTIETKTTGYNAFTWKHDPPLCLLKLPHKDGARWEYRCPPQPGGLVAIKAMNTAHGVEDIEVPAGKFEAIRVDHRGTSNGKLSSATFWYAPEVGLVKMVAEGIVQELTSVEPRK
jgi:hypothetical protein